MKKTLLILVSIIACIAGGGRAGTLDGFSSGRTKCGINNPTNNWKSEAEIILIKMQG